jgi:hypothetical protein
VQVPWHGVVLVITAQHAPQPFSNLRNRLVHLPRTDLSGLRLEFDIEYDHDLDGAMSLRPVKSPAWPEGRS